MQLTRRDAIVALGVLGTSSYAVSRARERGVEAGQVGTVCAVADVIYPSQVDVEAEFVETYLLGRTHASERFESGMASAVSALDETARSEYGQSFTPLSRDRRRSVLRSLGVDRAHSVPDGTTSQRVRYFLVNELLYALFTSPVGGRLLGIENPPGYPGGQTAYQRGSDE